MMVATAWQLAPTINTIAWDGARIGGRTLHSLVSSLIVGPESKLADNLLSKKESPMDVAELQLIPTRLSQHGESLLLIGTRRRRVTGQTKREANFT